MGLYPGTREYRLHAYITLYESLPFDVYLHCINRHLITYLLSYLLIYLLISCDNGEGDVTTELRM